MSNQGRQLANYACSAVVYTLPCTYTRVHTGSVLNLHNKLDQQSARMQADKKMWKKTKMEYTYCERSWRSIESILLL